MIKKRGRRMREEKRTWLMLIFALDLEDVEEVGGSSVDLDEVLIGFGGRVGKVRHLELLGRLMVMRLGSVVIYLVS